IIGQYQLGELRQAGGDDFGSRAFAREQLPTDFGECQVGFAANDVVGQLHDGLGLGLVADFRPAQDDGDVGSQAFEGRDDLGRGRDVPDVNAEPDDLRIPRQQRLYDVHRALVDIEL